MRAKNIFLQDAQFLSSRLWCCISQSKCISLLFRESITATDLNKWQFLVIDPSQQSAV